MVSWLHIFVVLLSSIASKRLMNMPIKHFVLKSTCATVIENRTVASELIHSMHALVYSLILFFRPNAIPGRMTRIRFDVICAIVWKYYINNHSWVISQMLSNCGHLQSFSRYFEEQAIITFEAKKKTYYCFKWPTSISGFSFFWTEAVLSSYIFLNMIE